MQQLKIGDFVDFIDVSRLLVDGHIHLSESAHWYCVVVRAGCQKRAEFELARLGYRTFYPRLRRWVSHARTKVAKEYPILGRYMFVEVDHPRQSFAPIVGTFEVDALVSDEGRPVPFPRREVESLIGRYLAGEWDEVAKGRIPVGARIKIVEGQFNDLLATVVSAKGRRLEVKIFGQQTRATVQECSARAA